MSTIPQSTTPRTDAAVRLTIGAGFNMVYPSFARELETELAAMTTRAEKAEADTVRMDWLEKESPEDWGIWSIDRATIDAAMKEGIK